jgi:mono/diheme cytochrome c family protein
MPGIRSLGLAAGAILALMARSGLADSGDSDTSADADAAKRGAEVFASHGCGYCHENGGRSVGKGPQLMGTKRDDTFIAFRITNGKPARMPAFGSSLTGEQILDLIAYIRSLKE